MKKMKKIQYSHCLTEFAKLYDEITKNLEIIANLTKEVNSLKLRILLLESKIIK